MKNTHRFIFPLIASCTALCVFTTSMIAQNKCSNQKSETWDPNKVKFSSYYSNSRDVMIFPKVMTYEVIPCDFHTHTIFSDGLVWPTLRVSEAWTEGLDALAITDHIEYKPHKDWLKNDNNTSFDIAKPAADETGLLLIKGAEITRKQSVFGHFNALFIQDANAISVDDPKQAILEAKKQNAFIIWNHPGWAVDSTYIREFPKDLLKEGLINGIEVYNSSEFYPRVLAWAIEKNLTIIAASDVHGNVESGELRKEGVRRPMTLVLSKDHSLAGIREALDAGRTLALFHNFLAAREDIATAFINASISIKKETTNEKNSFYTLSNKSSVPFKMFFNKNLYELPALSAISVTVPKDTEKISVVFENIFVNEGKTLAHDLLLK